MLLFAIWNLKNTIAYKCERLVLSRTSVYFAISKLIPLFSYSFHLPCISFLTFIFALYVQCFPFFLIDRNRKQVLLIKSLEAKKYFCALFNFLKMVIFTTMFRRWSTLWNSTLKIITTLFRRCLTLLISKLK